MSSSESFQGGPEPETVTVSTAANQLADFFDAQELDSTQFAENIPAFTHATALFIRQNLDDLNSQPGAAPRPTIPKVTVQNCLNEFYAQTAQAPAARCNFTRYVGVAYDRRLTFVEIQYALALSDQLPEDHFVQSCLSDLLIGYGMATAQIRSGG